MFLPQSVSSKMTAYDVLNFFFDSVLIINQNLVTLFRGLVPYLFDR